MGNQLVNFGIVGAAVYVAFVVAAALAAAFLCRAAWRHGSGAVAAAWGAGAGFLARAAESLAERNWLPGPVPIPVRA